MHPIEYALMPALIIQVSLNKYVYPMLQPPAHPGLPRTWTAEPVHVSFMLRAAGSAAGTYTSNNKGNSMRFTASRTRTPHRLRHAPVITECLLAAARYTSVTVMLNTIQIILHRIFSAIQ